MKLNARQIDTAKPKEKAYKLADGGGLYLLVKPSGGKYWRFKYRVAGKEKLLALGVYPEVTLADARAKREEAKRGIAGGIDPMEAKREEKIARETQLNNTFKDIALEWHSSKLKNGLLVMLQTSSKPSTKMCSLTLAKNQSPKSNHLNC